MIKPGEEWGAPTDEEPVATVTGDDRALATWLAAFDPAAPAPLVRFVPQGSDLARAVGLAATERDADRARRGIALPLDAIATEPIGAVNSVVVGRRPDRLRAWHRSRPLSVVVDDRIVFDGAATSVVVMNGQYLGDADVAPRGHPGDGRLEVQVYALGAGERAAMRRRLPVGAHVPHPRIVTTTGREILVRAGRKLPVSLDGHPAGSAVTLALRVRPGAVRLLV